MEPENLLQPSENEQQNLIERESQQQNLIERLFSKLSESQLENLIERILFKQLSESQLESLIERVLFKLHLKNDDINIASKNSAGKSSTDLKESENSSNSPPEKSLKQKSLDNWIVKSKTLSSNCEKELAKETEELSRNVESEEDEVGKKLENAINKKKLMVLLNRQDCLESMQKSLDHSKLSPEKEWSNPVNIKSPIEKNIHVSENSDEQNITPKKHSPIPTRSYNLRARGVINEKPCDETKKPMATSAECEDSDKILKPIHKSVSKQKQKLKTSIGKDTSSNSSFEEMDYDQKTNSCSDKTSENNIQNSDCKTSPTLARSESERILVDSNKINVTGENPTVVKLDPSLVIKGKRKRSCKDKESKKVCTSSAVQKSLDNQESAVTELNECNKSAEYIPSNKVTKLSIINADSSELTVEKTAQLPVTVVSTSPSEKQVTTNNIVKSVSKQKKKTIKSKVKSDMALHEKIKLDSAASKIKNKYLPCQEINSDITINIDFQRTSDEQLESTRNSDSQIKELVEEAEKLLTKDTKSLIAVHGDSKRISRKRDRESKIMVITEHSSLSDQEPTSKIHDKDNTTSINSLSKISPSQNKKFAKETNELLIKETHVLNSLDPKIMCKKKDKMSAKNRLISESEQSSRNNDEVSSASLETSSIDSLRNLISPSKKFPKVIEESLIKGADTVIQLDVNSKKKYRKKSNESKNKISTNNNFKSESEQSPKSNAMDGFALKTSSIDTLKNSLSQSKEFIKDTEESFIKDTATVTTLNIKSKKICRKKSSQNKNRITSKKSLIADSEEASKINEMSNITPSETSSFDSSKNSSPQSKELAKATEELLIKDTSIETRLAANSKRIHRKKGSGNKSQLVAKTNLIFNSGPASKSSDKDNIISTLTDSSSNSPSQNEKFGKETEEFLIKDTTTATPLSVKSKRICGGKNNENKSMAATKNILKSDSEQTSKNNDKNTNNSIKTSLIDSSKISTAKDISTKQISSSDTEETVSLNWNNCPKLVNAFTDSDDHSRKNSKSLNGNSYNQLSVLNEKKQTKDYLSKKSNIDQLNVPQTNDNIQESSQVSGVSKKVSTLKKKTEMQIPTNSKKKLKVTKGEIQSNTSQSSSHNLNIENENLHLKKSDSKKTVSTKIKLGSDFNKKLLIAQSMANSSHSNAVQEPKDPLLKNSKLDNKHGQAREETIKLKNSKKVKKSHSKKENNLESQIVCNSYISKNDEIEKLNCNLVSESSMKKKLHKGTNLSMIKTDNSESKKANHDVIKMDGKIEKTTDLISNNSNNSDSAEINFKDLIEFDEKMKHNYEAFCKVKEVLKVVGINIEELFENPEMINSLKSVPPNGVYFISKCKSDSKVTIHMHESKKEVRNILNEMKKKSIDEAK